MKPRNFGGVKMYIWKLIKKAKEIKNKQRVQRYLQGGLSSNYQIEKIISDARQEFIMKHGHLFINQIY